MRYRPAELAGKYWSLRASGDVGLRLHALVPLVKSRPCHLFLDGTDQPQHLLCKISILFHLFGYGSLQGGLHCH
jgi:hypothetical protein